MVIVSDPKTSAFARQELAATAIANARGARRGAPPVANVLDLLPIALRDEVMDDADAVLKALRRAGIAV